LMRKLALVLFSVAVLVLASCGGSSSSTASKPATTVVLHFWNAYNTTDKEASTMANVIIPRFEKEHPGIKVVSDVFPYSELLPKLLAAISAGNPPDLVRSDIIWVPQLAQQGALVPLSKDLPGFSKLAKETFPGPLSTCEWKGVYYGLPLDTNTQVLFYNKTDFAAAGIQNPPSTLSELFQDAVKLTNPAKHQWGLGVDGTDIWNVSPFIWSYGGSFTNPTYTKASGYLNGPTTVAIITKLVDMYMKGYIGNDFLGGSGAISGEQGFPKGQYAMYIDGPWAVATYQQSFPSLSYGMEPMPPGAGGSRSVTGGEDIVIPAGSKHIKQAELFLKFLLSPWAQLKMAEVGQMSVLKTISNQEIAAVPYYAPFAKQLLTAEARPPVPQYTQLDTDFSNGLQEILKGAPIQATLNSVASQIDALLAQNGG